MHTYLRSLTLLNFKNYEDASLEFCAKINCITGNNGVGKTNILDAVHYLSLCKSFFTATDSQNVKFSHDFFVIQGEYLSNDKHENIYCGVKIGQKKIFKRNAKEYEKLTDHIGFIPVVIVSPADSNLIIDGSEERRKFIDIVLSQFDHTYLDDLVRYNRALTQRNLQLKDFALKNWFDPEMLELWNDQLIHTGTRIFEKRKAFIQELVPVFQHYYNFISQGRELVGLTYESQLNDADFGLLLQNSVEKDRKFQYTTVGIHKDDLDLELSGYPIKRVGSQGQQKTFLVALKLAQFDYIKQHTGKYPILLLDDIFDKFDANRVAMIIELVSSPNFGQIFITDTHSDRMEDILKNLSVEYKIHQIGLDN